MNDPGAIRVDVAAIRRDAESRLAAYGSRTIGLSDRVSPELLARHCLALLDVAEAARGSLADSVSLPPADCADACGMGECNCSGVWRYPPATQRMAAALARLDFGDGA